MLSMLNINLILNDYINNLSILLLYLIVISFNMSLPKSHAWLFYFFKSNDGDDVAILNAR